MVYTEGTDTLNPIFVMGKTRDILNSINHLIDEHDIGKRFLIKKYCDNPNLEKFYRNQIEAYDQKYEKQLRDLFDDHIEYLEEKDPYGRQPLWGAEAKKQLFLNARQKLDPEHCEGEMYIRKLAKLTAELLHNDIIDKPRWPSLQLDNVFHFFKSMFSSKNAYLDNVQTKQEDYKTAHKSKSPKT